MIRRLLPALILAGGILALAPVPTDAEVTYNECFSNCHEAAMHLYETFESLQFATVWFEGCMHHCPVPS